MRIVGEAPTTLCAHSQPGCGSYFWCKVAEEDNVFVEIVVGVVVPMCRKHADQLLGQYNDSRS